MGFQFQFKHFVYCQKARDNRQPVEQMLPFGVVVDCSNDRNKKAEHSNERVKKEKGILLLTFSFHST